MKETFPVVFEVLYFNLFEINYFWKYRKKQWKSHYICVLVFVEYLIIGYRKSVSEKFLDIFRVFFKV
jgi:hypothetical protein